MKILIFILILGFTLSAHATRKMVTIKGGTFTPLYGTYKKQITISNFQIDAYPVTNREFLEFIKQHPEWMKSKIKQIFSDGSYLSHWSGDLELGPNALEDGPIVSVSWFAAKAFCESENKRLPTVNEWEFVAAKPIPGKDIKRVILDWYSVPTPDVMPSIKSGIVNSDGLSSLHGFIWEWTLDFNSTMVTGESRADGQLDKTLFCGSGSSGASDQTDYAAFIRFGFRSSLKANYSVRNLGFRCAKEEE